MVQRYYFSSSTLGKPQVDLGLLPFQLFEWAGVTGCPCSSSFSKARLLISRRRPIRMQGSRPSRAASYARLRLILRAVAASSTVMVKFSCSTVVPPINYWFRLLTSNTPYVILFLWYCQRWGMSLNIINNVDVTSIKCDDKSPQITNPKNF